MPTKDDADESTMPTRDDADESTMPARTTMPRRHT
jgi:hypothetical protein